MGLTLLSTRMAHEAVSSYRAPSLQSQSTATHLMWLHCIYTLKMFYIAGFTFYCLNCLMLLSVFLYIVMIANTVNISYTVVISSIQHQQKYHHYSTEHLLHSNYERHNIIFLFLLPSPISFLPSALLPNYIQIFHTSISVVFPYCLLPTHLDSTLVSHIFTMLLFHVYSVAMTSSLFNFDQFLAFPVLSVVS